MTGINSPPWRNRDGHSTDYLLPCRLMVSALGMPRPFCVRWDITFQENSPCGATRAQGGTGSLESNLLRHRQGRERVAGETRGDRGQAVRHLLYGGV